MPPQSTPVSSPFLMPSLQVGISQSPFLQTPLTQSAFVVQGDALPHGGHAPPPQSMPVSTAFCTPSAQLAI